MIRRLLIGLLASAVSLGAAQAKDFEVLINLPKGATIDLVVEHSREDTRQGKATKSASTSRYRQVLTPTAEGYRVRQTLTAMEGGPAAGLSLDAVGGASDLTYDADEALTPLRILEWPATADRMMDLFAKATPSAPTEALNGARKMFQAMSPEQAASVLLKEQNFLVVPQMASLDLGKPVSADEQLPNPLGGPPIDSTFTIELQNIDRAAGRAVVRTRQALEPASAMASMRKTFEVLAANAGAPPPTEAVLAGMGMERTTTCLYDMDLKTGLTAKADCAMKSVISSPAETAMRDERWVVTQTLVSQP